MRYFSIIALLALASSAAIAQLTQTGAGNVAGGGGGTTGFILMIDNTSRILQVDNVSKICRAGGC